MDMDDLLEEDLRERTAAFLLDIHAHIAASLEKSQVDFDKASEIATEVVDHIRHSYGGELVYVPKGTELDAAVKHHAIFKEFNGHNHAALAKKYGVTKHWVYNVVKMMQQRLKDKVQPTLF